MPATDSQHLEGHNVDRLDQLSSVTLLGIAVIGSLAVIVLNLLLIG